MNRPTCNCFDQYDIMQWTETSFHVEEQDTTCAPWHTLAQLIEEAAADQRAEFAPFREMTWEERSHIITLPPTTAKLTSVKHLNLYGSYLVRLPPEIGSMISLEEFTPYTSHRLHWFPYEIIRCTKLKRSTVSTRSLYGNHKLRPPFPKLRAGRLRTQGLDLNRLSPAIWGADSVKTCSICNTLFEHGGVYQVWISLSVGTDILPLLVHACSEVCIQKLPHPPENYVQFPHRGGLEVQQPKADYDFSP